MSKLVLNDKHATASEVPSRRGEIRIGLSGPQVGTWALDHAEEDLSPFGFFVTSGGPQFTVRVVGRRAVGPAYLAGSIELGLMVDLSEFANSFEAAQLAIARLAELPDAEHLAHASLRVEIEAGR